MTDAAAWLEAVVPPPPGELVVAVSGGADSAFLAWAMTQLSEPRLVHVDHGTVGSPGLRAAADRLALHLGLELTTVEVVVPPGASWEAQARRVRREALRSVAGEATIATGHHADDQVETVIGNLARGAGSTGLAGMQPSGDGWCKPLLRMSRSRIREAAVGLGLPFTDDPSNDDIGMRRNLIRHSVLPVLETAFPGISARVVVTADLMARDDRRLEAEADRLVVRRTSEGVELSSGELVAAGDAVASRAVRRAIRLLDGTYPGTAADVAAVLAVAAGTAGRTTIGGDIVVEVEHAMVVMRPAGSAPLPWEAVTMTVPGRIEVGDRWVRATADRVAATGPRRVRLDAAALGDDVVLRPAATGDRIDIGTGSKLVSDALREAAIRPSRRSSWPVVEAHGTIAWLVGVRPAAWAVAGTGTTAVLFETGAV